MQDQDTKKILLTKLKDISQTTFNNLSQCGKLHDRTVYVVKKGDTVVRCKPIIKRCKSHLCTECREKWEKRVIPLVSKAAQDEELTQITATYSWEDYIDLGRHGIKKLKNRICIAFRDMNYLTNWAVCNNNTVELRILLINPTNHFKIPTMGTELFSIKKITLDQVPSFVRINTAWHQIPDDTLKSMLLILHDTKPLNVSRDGKAKNQGRLFNLSNTTAKEETVTTDSLYGIVEDSALEPNNKQLEKTTTTLFVSAIHKCNSKLKQADKQGDNRAVVYFTNQIKTWQSKLNGYKLLLVDCRTVQSIGDTVVTKDVSDWIAYNQPKYTNFGRWQPKPPHQPNKFKFAEMLSQSQKDYQTDDVKHYCKS